MMISSDVFWYCSLKGKDIEIPSLYKINFRFLELIYKNVKCRD